MYKVKSYCRSCGSENLQDIIYFGETPLSDALLTEKQLTEEEIKVPLTLAFCPNCSLVQIREEVDPEVLFCRDYPYYSSVSKSLMEHFGNSAKEIIKMRNLNENSMVIEAASNDGYMLKHFVSQKISVLGIDPAEGPAKIAEQNGVNTLNTFFTVKLAKKLRDEQNISADVFLANNVLAHVPDLNGFVEGIAILLKETGVAVIESPYLVDLVDHSEFDTIYHQHLCYYSVTALDKLFRRHGLFLNDIKHVQIHGGTLRLFIEKNENVSQTVKTYLEEEKRRKVDTFEYYENFAEKVVRIKKELLKILDEVKTENKKIIGYAAAAKANTLMSYIGIGSNYLEYIADLSKFKQGKFFSGNHLPIVSPERILEDMPDYMLIMAWNFAEEIMSQQSEFKNSGGKFIIPIPTPKII